MKGSYLLNLTDDTYKKLLIYIQYKVIYDDKNYFWKILTSIQMKPSTLRCLVFIYDRKIPKGSVLNCQWEIANHCANMWFV